jgi:fatty acid synthase subunit alpha
MPLVASIFQVQNLISPKTWGLGPQRADAMPLIATTMKPAKHLGSEAEGKAWLDSAAQVYAQCVESLFPLAAAAVLLEVRAVMNSEKFLKFQAEQHEFAHQQINLYSRYLMQQGKCSFKAILD